MVKNVKNKRERVKAEHPESGPTRRVNKAGLTISYFSLL
jgi:hypothetical protein